MNTNDTTHGLSWVSIYKTLLVLVTLAVLAGLISCAPSLSPVSPAQAAWAAQRWPGTNLASLEQTRTFYIDRCSNCHNAPTPTSEKPEKWPEILDKMAVKAKLTPEQREQIERYIVVAQQNLK